MNAPLRLSTLRGKATLAASILGSSLAFVDSTAVNVALPAIGRDLGADFNAFQWIVNAYMITLGALVLTGGALADLRGRRRIFLTGVVWFSLASLLCAAAPTTVTLIGARALQGIGAALLIPSSLALLQVSFDPEDRGRVIGIWSGFSGVSALVGPVVGGWLIDEISWRAVFAVNPVVALPVVALSLLGTPTDPPRREPRQSADTLGAAAAVGALGGLVFALIQGPVWGWSDPKVVAALALGLVSAVGFVDLERSQARPMLPLNLFRSRRFSGANLVTLFIYFVPAGAFFLLTLQLQRVLGYTAFEAGAAQAPVTVLFLLLSPLAGRFADRHGPLIPLVVGPLVGAVGVGLLSGVDASSSFVRGILPGILTFGAGMGITVAPLTSAALSALDDRRAGLASGVNNAVARVAQLLAIPLLPIAAGISGIERVGGLSFSAGYGRAMWVCAALFVAGAIAAWGTMRGPADLSRRGAGDSAG